MYESMLDTIGAVALQDPEVAAALGRELTRQRQNIELIASENIVSPAVMAAMGLSLIHICLLFGITLGLGLNGFFLGHSLAIWITALLSFGYYLSGHWQRRKLAVQQD